MKVAILLRFYRWKDFRDLVGEEAENHLGRESVRGQSEP